MTAECSVSMLGQADGRGGGGLTGLQRDVRGLEGAGGRLLVVALARAEKSRRILGHAAIVGEGWDGPLLHGHTVAGEVGVLEDGGRVAAHPMQALGDLGSGAVVGV